MLQKKIKFSLGFQILAALFLGILFGYLLNKGFISDSYKNFIIDNILQPAGDIFIKLIKMIVMPIVISTLIIGISGMGNAKKIGTIGAKTIIYFEIITTIAIIIGIFFANVFKPGVGVHLENVSKGDLSHYQQSLTTIHHGFKDILIDLVPSNIFQSINTGNMLQVIFFCTFFALGITTLSKERREPIINFFKSVADGMFWVTKKIMLFAPIGVFAFMSISVSKYGLDSLIPLSKLVLVVYAAIIFFAFAILGTVAKICGLNIIKIIRILKEDLLLAFSTATSEMVLPNLIDKTKKYGAPEEIADLVIPTGYTFNLDGSTLYQSIAAIFIAQISGINLSIWQEITLVFTLMVTSKGIAGVPGVSFVVLMATLPTINVPIDNIAFILAVDRILDMARTALNVVGNALAVLVIAKWEKSYDTKKALKYEKEILYNSNNQ